MKKVVIVTSPFKLDDLKDVLGEVGVRGITITEVKVPSEEARVIGLDFASKIALETVIMDDMEEDVVEAVLSISQDADGMIYIIPVEDAVRIRTGDTGKEALV